MCPPKAFEVVALVWILRAGGKTVTKGARQHVIAHCRMFRHNGWKGTPEQYPMVSVPDRKPIGIA